jgi:hypothetical protein
MTKGFLYLLILLFSFSSQARWVDINDASIEYNINNADITVNDNGTSETAYERKFKILNEQGRSNYATYRIYYNESTTKLNIISAYTIHQNKKYLVDLKKIEDKPLASSAAGFDDYRQISLSFPKAEIGAELYIKYSTVESKTMLPNFYANIMYVGYNGCWNKGHINITSKIPLYMEINDPYSSLDIQQTHKDDQNKIAIDLKKKICSEIIYNSEIGSISENKYTWVSLSSIENRSDYAKQVAIKYEKVINQPLPQLFQPIMEEAKLINDPIAQINFVTSSINEKIRYMGDWSSIEGAFFPRDLNIIANLQEADCKEFTSLTANILKKLGYKTQPALVDRDSRNISFIKKLPEMWFNHVILKVTDKTGTIYWVDPTNIVSMAQDIFPDVSNKHVLILDSIAPSYEKSPMIDPSKSTVILNDTLTIHQDKVHHIGELSLNGTRSLLFSGNGLHESEEAIKDNIFSILSKENLSTENKVKVTLPDVKSRIVKDLNFKFEYNVDNQLIKSNLGKAIILPSDWSYWIINYIPNQLSDLYIGPNRTIKKSTTIKNLKAENIESLHYELDSKWLHFKRSCRVIKGDSLIEEIIVIKESFIESTELKSEEYQKLKRNIKANIDKVIIILN